MSLDLLESALHRYAQLHAKPHHRQLNRYPITREMLYIPIPQLRAFPFDHTLRLDEKMELFHQTSVNDCQTWLLFGYEKVPPEKLLPYRDGLLDLINSCDNRRISDSLSSIYTRLLDHDRSLYPILSERNSSANARKRRQSVVSLYYYARSRKNPLPYDDAIILIESLLDDSDYYVQKGVGRTLRELYHLYPEQTLAWIRSHVSALHPRAWQAATEKLSREEKEELKKKRRRR